MDVRRDELLVAVDDEASFAALDWAVERALRSGLNLHIVHVAHSRHGLTGELTRRVTSTTLSPSAVSSCGWLGSARRRSPVPR